MLEASLALRNVEGGEDWEKSGVFVGNGNYLIPKSL